MIRRRLVIEWNDDGTDDDQECAYTFMAGQWGIADLLDIDVGERQHPETVTLYPVDLKVWVEDAPSPAISSIQCPHCKWGYAPSVIKQHIQSCGSKHNA